MALLNRNQRGSTVLTCVVVACIALGSCSGGVGEGIGTGGAGGSSSSSSSGGAPNSTPAAGNSGTGATTEGGAAGATKGSGGAGAGGVDAGEMGDASSAGGSAMGGSREAGRADAATVRDATIPMDAAIGGESLCQAGKYIVCEGFEQTAEGAVPTGWTRTGSVAVASDAAARGTHALKIGAAASGARRISMNAAALGSGHWGRIFYRVSIPPPLPAGGAVIHSTLVALSGTSPLGGTEEVRVVDTVENSQGMHQFLYNVQPSAKAEFGKGSAYNWRYDGQWHCAEWHIDSPTQGYHFYLDGTEVTPIAINNGAGNFTNSEIPLVFTTVAVGWNNYQTANPSFVAWIDEVALDLTRIGCDG